MSRNLPSTLNSQSGKLNLGEIMSGISEFIENLRFSFGFDVFDVLNERNPDIEQFFMILYNGKFPQMTSDSKDVFLKKHSYAKDEWCVPIKDLLSFDRLQTLQRLYDSNLVNYWSNEDDFSFYQVETIREGRRLRVIFYNSSNRRTGEKLSFQELLEKNQPVRVCWY